MVTKNPNSIIDTLKLERNEHKHNTKEMHQNHKEKKIRIKQTSLKLRQRNRGKKPPKVFLKI